MDTLAAVLNSMGVAVVISDRKRQLRFMNRMTQQLTGWTLQETAGKNLSDVLPLKHDETRGVIEHTVADVSTLSDTTVSFDDHTLLRPKEGAEIPIEGCDSPIRADGGGTQGVVTVFRNATRCKRARVDRDALLEEFLGCLAKAKPFSGTLPICAWCNKIQDDRGRWYAVEEYIPEHNEAQLATG